MWFGLLITRSGGQVGAPRLLGEEPQPLWRERGTDCAFGSGEHHLEPVFRPECVLSQGPEEWELETQKQKEGINTAPVGLGS